MAERDYNPQDDMTRWMYESGFTRDDILSQVLKLGEEYHEAMSSYLQDEGDDRFASELVDLGLVTMGILSLMNRSFDEEAAAKMQVTQEKYPPQEIQCLMMQGLTLQESLHILKHRWNRGHGVDLVLAPSGQDP